MRRESLAHIWKTTTWWWKSFSTPTPTNVQRVKKSRYRYRTVKLQAMACLKNCWLKQNWSILALFVSCFSSELEQQFERLWSTLIVKQMIFHWRCWAFEWQCWHKSANHLEIRAADKIHTGVLSQLKIERVFTNSSQIYNDYFHISVYPWIYYSLSE